MLPWPSSPPRCSGSVERHPAELASVYIRDAVVPRQPLVDESVIGAQQIQDAAILAQLALDEQLRLLLERLAQVVVEIGEEVGIGDRVCGCRAAAATGRRSFRPARWSVDRPACGAICVLENRRDLSACPRSAALEQFIVGDAAPQEEREPRGQFQIASVI